MIDFKPAVGRFLLRESYSSDGFVSFGGIITEVSGRLIYFIGPSDTIEEGVDHFAVICDTQEEVDALLKFEQTCSAARHELGMKHLKDFKILIAANNAVPDSHDEPVNPDYQYLMGKTQIPDLLVKQHGKLDDIRSAFFELHYFTRIPEDGSQEDLWGFGMLPNCCFVILGDELWTVQPLESDPLFDHWMTLDEIAALKQRNKELRSEVP